MAAGLESGYHGILSGETINTAISNAITAARSSVTKTANYLALSSDYTILMNCASGALVLSLPTASSSANLVLNVVKTDASANVCTIQANGTDLISGSSAEALTAQWASITIQSNGSFWVII